MSRLSLPAEVLLAALAVLTGCDHGRTVIVIADAGNTRIVQMDDFSGAGGMGPSSNRLPFPGPIASPSRRWRIAPCAIFSGEEDED